VEPGNDDGKHINCVGETAGCSGGDGIDHCLTWRASGCRRV